LQTSYHLSTIVIWHLKGGERGLDRSVRLGLDRSTQLGLDRSIHSVSTDRFNSVLIWDSKIIFFELFWVWLVSVLFCFCIINVLFCFVSFVSFKLENMALWGPKWIKNIRNVSYICYLIMDVLCNKLHSYTCQCKNEYFSDNTQWMKT
jgi:hypothetical protein